MTQQCHWSSDLLNQSRAHRGQGQMLPLHLVEHKTYLSFGVIGNQFKEGMPWAPSQRGQQNGSSPRSLCPAASSPAPRRGIQVWIAQQQQQLGSLSPQIRLNLPLPLPCPALVPLSNNHTPSPHPRAQDRDISQCTKLIKYASAERNLAVQSKGVVPPVQFCAHRNFGRSVP